MKFTLQVIKPFNSYIIKPSIEQVGNQQGVKVGHCWFNIAFLPPLDMAEGVNKLAFLYDVKLGEKPNQYDEIEVTPIWNYEDSSIGELKTYTNRID